MTIDLRYRVYTAMLTASLWIPYVVCVPRMLRLKRVHGRL